jgi:hypothetical protein
VETGSIGDVLGALAMWSGLASFSLAGDLLRTGLAFVEPWVAAPGVLGVHTTVTDALTRWGMLVGSAGAASIFMLPRLLAIGDR